MSSEHEFNPHFYYQDPRRPRQPKQPRRQQQPQPQPPPQQLQPQPQPQPELQPPAEPTQHHHHQPHQRNGHIQHPAGLKVLHPRRTKPIAWFVAIFCTIFWVIIILGGLAILIVYLVFRPQSPRFDIENAGLNAAYLDTGILLNADITLLANFTNPNKRVGVDFSFIAFQLYYGKTLIATTAIDAFSEARTESKLANIHMVTSEVRIPVNDIQRLKKQVQMNSVPFYVYGMFRTRSRFGNFLSYTYWLHGQCTIVLTAPPSGVLVSRKCKTKR